MRRTGLAGGRGPVANYLGGRLRDQTEVNIPDTVRCRKQNSACVKVLSIFGVLGILGQRVLEARRA